MTHQVNEICFGYKRFMLEHCILRLSGLKSFKWDQIISQNFEVWPEYSGHWMAIGWILNGHWMDIEWPLDGHRQAVFIWKIECSPD